jgi:hypothetical protein
MRTISLGSFNADSVRRTRPVVVIDAVRRASSATRAEAEDTYRRLRRQPAARSLVAVPHGLRSGHQREQARRDLVDAAAAIDDGRAYRGLLRAVEDGVEWDIVAELLSTRLALGPEPLPHRRAKQITRARAAARVAGRPDPADLTRLTRRTSCAGASSRPGPRRP